MRYLTRKNQCITMSPDNGEYNSPKGGGLAWQLDVGAECNRLLDIACKIGEAGDEGQLVSNQNEQLAKDIRSIVARVAELEKLEKEPDDSQSKMP